MFSDRILSAHWDDYNRRKALANQDHNIFCPDEPWEFNYLVDAIVAAIPHLDPFTVMLAVRQVSRQTYVQRLREKFIHVVMLSIQEREDRLARIINGQGREPDC